VFAGNRTDVTTLPEMVGLMEEKYGQPGRVWVLDRGMVSEENLAWLWGRGAQYVVGTPKGQLRQFEKALVEKGELRSMDVVLPAAEGGEVRLRVVARPEKPLARLLAQLGLELPSAPRPVGNVVPKTAPSAS